MSRRSYEIRLQLKVEIKKKETAENALTDLPQEIEKTTEELTSGVPETADSIVEFSGDESKEENYAENKRNLPELKDKQIKPSEDFLSKEQQKTCDLELMAAEEIAKRQKVEKKDLDLKAMIESEENTQMEIKVLKDLCQEEAQLRRDLQADALNKNLRIEQ